MNLAKIIGKPTSNCEPTLLGGEKKSQIVKLGGVKPKNAKPIRNYEPRQRGGVDLHFRVIRWGVNRIGLSPIVIWPVRLQ